MLPPEEFLELARSNPYLTFNDAQHWLDENAPGYAVIGTFSSVTIFDDEGHLYAWLVNGGTDGAHWRFRGSLHQYPVKKI